MNFSVEAFNKVLGNADPTAMNITPKMHNHLNWVFDLETYATNRNAIVPEISAVAFDIGTGNVYHECTFHIDVDSQVQLGREVSSGTLAFWLQQSEEARNKMLLADYKYCKDNGLSLPTPIGGAMVQLSNIIRDVSAKWAEENNASPDPLVWGNGISFDLGKTTSLFESMHIDLPWQYWAERDARTIMDLCPDVKQALWSDFQGVQHFGLDDCKHEVRYLSLAYMLIFRAGSLIAESTNVKTELAQ